MAYTKKKRVLNLNDPNAMADQFYFHVLITLFLYDSNFDLCQNINNISNKVHCDFCDKEITKHARIIDPQAPDIDVCMNCFMNARENQRHLKTAPYHVVNKLNFPLFDPNWTAEEELLMLEGLEKSGFGNWNDIAELISSDKTKDDVEKHYETYFLSESNFIPNAGTILTKRDENNCLVYPSSANGNKMDIESEAKPKKKALGKNQGLEKRDMANLNQVSQLSKTPSVNFNKDSNTSASEIIGYMPLRGDFDFEFDNEAELLLAEMEFNGNLFLFSAVYS